MSGTQWTRKRKTHSWAISSPISAQHFHCCLQAHPSERSHSCPPFMSGWNYSCQLIHSSGYSVHSYKKTERWQFISIFETNHRCSVINSHLSIDRSMLMLSYAMLWFAFMVLFLPSAIAKTASKPSHIQTKAAPGQLGLYLLWVRS